MTITLIKMVAFFILISAGIVSFLISFSNPIFILGAISAVALGLYIVGYTPSFASPKAQLENYQKEINNYYLSDSKKIRDKIVGAVALSLGIGGLYLIIHQQKIMESFAVLVFSVIMTGFGALLFSPKKLTEKLFKKTSIVKIEEDNDPPKFHWTNLSFFFAMIRKNYEKAEQILLKRSETANLDFEQKTIFLEHGKFWIDKRRKEDSSK